MKKLMIAAAAAAMVGGAFAADFAGVYNLKFTLKTLTPKDQLCTKCNICNPEGTGEYYENGTVKLEGIIAYCSECTLMREDYATAVLALWDPNNKQRVYFDGAWKTATSVTNLILAAGWNNVKVENVFKRIDTTVYGKSSTKVGLDFVMDYTDKYIRGGDWDLRATGLGTYCWTDDPKGVKGNKLLGYVKSLSGNVAGRIPYKTGYNKENGTYWGATIVANECAGAANYCEDGGNYEDPDTLDVPAYGTWTMKYNASATQKKLYQSLPSYVLKADF